MTKAGAGLRTLKDLEGKRVLIPMQERDEIEGPLATLQYDAYTHVTTPELRRVRGRRREWQRRRAALQLDNSINIAVQMALKRGAFAARSCGTTAWAWSRATRCCSRR